jgi:GNAT superfamily N-acetyltransferase
MLIRDLDPVDDLDAVHGFYLAAPDYWIMAEGVAPGLTKARAFFRDCPPGCDPAQSRRLGLFHHRRLSGLAELSFGFPHEDAAYLGFMMIGPWARNAGFGGHLLADVERIGVETGSGELYLAVLDINHDARRFWQRQGFAPTGVTGTSVTGQGLTRMLKFLR